MQVVPMTQNNQTPVIIKAKQKIANGERSEAITLLLPEAKKGNVEAQYMVGEAYLFGEGVAVDFGEAKFWLDSAYQNGSAKAAIRLASLYETGGKFADELLERESKKIRDKETAIKLYTYGFEHLLSLAENGDPEAMEWVAMCYQVGWGVKMDMETADQWYQKAKEAKAS